MLVALTFLLALAAAQPAPAQELTSLIATAEQRAEAARGEVGELKKELPPISSRYSRASRRARAARSEVRSAKADVATIKTERDTRRADAATRLHRIEDANRESQQNHDDRITSDIGLGLAAMVVALLVLAWDWFRASAAVAALTRFTAAQAVGICVGGGFLAVLIGAVMEGGGGLMAVLGTALVSLGLMLPAAFLLARHSAEIQRGRAKPWLGRERFPARVTQVLAAILGVVCLGAFGAAAFAPQAHSDEIPTGLQAVANGDGHGSSVLAAAEATALAAEREAAPALAAQARARSSLRHARRAVGQAERGMVAAERQARNLSRKLVAVELREQHEVEREERRALRAQEKEEREYERMLASEERKATREAETAAEAEACDPNYEGACLHEGIGDYDCEGGSGDGPNYVAGPVYVVGYDEFGLDSDGDGVGCED